MIRVMICDDMDTIRKHFIDCINRQSDMQAVCEASCAEEAVSRAVEYQPDVILMDIQMDEINSGIIATERIVKELPHIKVLMLTVYNDDDSVIEAYLAGAVDYLLKDAKLETICETIRKTFVSENFLGRRIAEVIRSEVIRTRKQGKSLVYFVNNIAKLTVTEKSILDLLYQKKKRKEIAEELYMSEETVKIHIRHILRKLDFMTTKELVAELEKMGIMELFN